MLTRASLYLGRVEFTNLVVFDDILRFNLAKSVVRIGT